MNAPFADLPLDPDEIFARIMDPARRGDDLVRLYHQLRSVAPVYQARIPGRGDPWVITRHADAERLARESGLIKDGRVIEMSGLGAEGPFVQVMRRMLSFIPPPRHTRLRMLVNKGFTKRSVEQTRPHVRALANQLIDARSAERRMDVVADYAFRIPVTVICEMIGVPVEDVSKLEGWARAITHRSDESHALTAERERAGDEATLAFVAYLQGLIAARRREPRDDLVSRLVAVQREAEDLTDDDIAATALLLFQAGHDTTANMIAKAVLALLRHPDQLRKLRERPELIQNAVEELLRYDTSVQLSLRHAIADVPFHGRTIRNGDPLMLLRGAINRDPEAFANPDALDLERKDIEHHSFGMGANFCLGASLARLEIQEALQTLFQRLPGLQLAAERPAYKDQLHLHGLVSLPVTW